MDQNEEQKPRGLDRILTGAAAGIVGTLVMSVWMLVAQRAGWLSQQPPKKITHESVRRTTGARPSFGSLALLSAVVHLGIGAGAAMLYALMTPRRLRIPAGAAAGTVAGLLMWVTSYVKLLPALDLMPAPTDDERRRPQAMIIGHVIYGAIVGALVSALGEARKSAVD